MRKIAGFLIAGTLLLFLILGLGLAIYVKLMQPDCTLAMAIGSSEVASWMQAIGSVGAVGCLIYTFHRQNELHQKEIDDKRKYHKEEQVKKEKEEKQKKFLANIFICRKILALLSEVINFAKFQHGSQYSRLELRNDLLVSHLLERLWKTEERIYDLADLWEENEKMIYAILLARNLLQYLQRSLAVPYLQGVSFNADERKFLDNEIQRVQEQYDIISRLLEEYFNSFSIS